MLTLDEGELCQQEGEESWAGQREGWWEKHKGGGGSRGSGGGKEDQRKHEARQ